MRDLWKSGDSYTMKKRCFVFAGQGAQFVGMGKDLAEAYPPCRELYEKADGILGWSLSKVCFEGPETELTRTDRCQPAIFVTSLACLEALRRETGEAATAAMAGLSLGEWTALHAAGAISFEDALRLLEARGRFMQEACDAREGGMLSVIGLGADAVKKVCEEAGVEISNFNSPGQTVLSGEKGRMAKAEELAKAAGAKKTVPLKVAGAYHSSLMEPAARKLEQALARVAIAGTSVPVVSNVTGRPHGGPDEIRRAMVRQVTSPVQWVAGVEWLRGNGTTEYVECGPGKVLSGLIGRIDGAAAVRNIQDVPSLRKAVEEISRPA